MKPDARGYFGRFGGRFVPEVLIAALDELERAMAEAFADPQFWDKGLALIEEQLTQAEALAATR